MTIITLADGSKKEFPARTKVEEIAKTLGIKNALAASVDEKQADLFYEINKDCKIKILTFDDAQGKEVLRHSTAHILAYAIQQLFPKAKNTIGPAIEDGFYYDFDFGEYKLTEEDLTKIEKKMHQIASLGLKYSRLTITKEQIKKLFPNNPYKEEVATEYEKEGLTIYKMGEEFIDLCKGPHVPDTSIIKGIKLTSIAGAYWRGDSTKTQLTRIYGTSFPSEKELETYLNQVEEAKKRDHRKLGKEMQIFHISEEIGPGLILWMPNGEIIRHELMEFMRQLESEQGYKYVSTPHITMGELYKLSGHLPYYEQDMYPPIIIDEKKYYLKPMNCPHHHMIFKQLVTSYRDMPLRLAEPGTVYRKELSGVSYGLMRVRGMTQNDSHIYCTTQQLKDEFIKVLQLFKKVYDTIKITDYWFRLSLPDFRSDKFVGDKNAWEEAANSIRQAMKDFKAKYTEVEGEAAFYGPKIDILIKNVLGKEETIATSQIDIVVSKRMNLTYIDENNKEQNPVIIHRAILGSYERFIAHLLEFFGARLPTWLAPEQVRILPITERSNNYAKKVLETLGNVRAKIDDRNERLQKKILEAETARTAYILVVGEKEEQAQTVSVRERTGKSTAKKFAEFAQELKNEIEQKR
ncbi:threonine--tRNA ligase [Candidatus Woesearchaeota archaeon]|nr:threonine--tRNA ligase [Candidatus Woesearchaeota archaeon]